MYIVSCLLNKQFTNNILLFSLYVIGFTQFLGILLNESLSWKPHIRALITKMTKSLGIPRKTYDSKKKLIYNITAHHMHINGHHTRS